MNRYDHEILYVQKTIQHFDVKRCRLIANWLSEHIQLLEVDQQLYKISIHQLRLSTRTYNVLQANKINSIGQLLKSSADWDNLKKLKGAGDKVLHEIKEKLTQVQAGKLIS